VSRPAQRVAAHGHRAKADAVAAKIAFPMAGASAMIGVSPPPAEGMSVLLTRCTSILGHREIAARGRRRKSH